MLYLIGLWVLQQVSRLSLNPKVNAQFKNMFDVWTSFLTSPESRYVLTTENDGWFGPAASIAMPNFVETFVSNPTAPFYGFTSWDDFFTRQFRPGVRPVEAADDNRIVNNACESTVYCIAHDVKAHDKFWLKGQPYSLYHMLDNDALAHQFVGGTIYQAFLSAIKYHRWHSPVDGTVVKTVSIPGTYYAGSPAMVFPNPDPSATTESQAFLTAVATRALIFIQADNPSIGLMCFIAVGMAEVSTCEITVRQGQRLKKGDQMGMFHFGGSTHCLVFRPETKIAFNPDYPVNAEVLLNVALATIDT
jgi:phosphatidylserine decarboxylase